MKKISFILIFALLLPCILLSSCGQKPTSDDGKFTVVCSIFPQYDFCRVITGGEDEVILLQENGVDMHSYEPTSKDILTIAKADMLIYTGGASDAWVQGVLHSADNEKIITASLFDYAQLLCASDLEAEHHHDHDHGQGEVCDEYDEHVWTSPKNVIKIVSKLCEELCRANPDGSDRYRKNTAEYIKELEALDTDYEQLFSSVEPTLIVADRFPFLYLAHDYDVNYRAAFSGCSSETGASFEVVLSLIDEVRESKAAVIFDTDNSGSDVAKRVAEECGVEIKTLYSCQSVTYAQLEDGESYISFMKKNLETLREAYRDVNS